MSATARFTAAWSAIALGVCAADSTAAELGYGVDIGAGRDDNVTRVADGEVDDTIAAVGAQLRLDHESKRIDAKVTSRLEYRDYLDDTFDSQLVGNLLGDLKFDLVEERFAWVVTDTFGQTSLDRLSPDTPTNRENVNFLTTGPDLKLPLGSRNALLLQGRYALVDYEESQLGNDRVTGELGLRRELSAASSVSLNVNTEQVSYDDEQLYPDFDRNEAYVNYEIHSARTKLSLSGGQTEIRSLGRTDDGWLGRFELSRQTSPALTVGMMLGHEFSDAGSSFVQQQVMQPGSTGTVAAQQIAAPFESEYATLFVRFARNRTSLDVRATHFDEHYDEFPAFDRKRLLVEAGVQRILSAVLTARLDANYSRSEFVEIGREFSELDATLGLRWQVGRVTSLDFDYTHFDRNDDSGVFDYQANQIWVRFAYQVGEGSGASAGM